MSDEWIMTILGFVALIFVGWVGYKIGEEEALKEAAIDVCDVQGASATLLGDGWKCLYDGRLFIPGEVILDIEPMYECEY
jgi:hypothetical protein